MEYMQYDRELILNILDRVYNSIEQIEKRSENYHCGDNLFNEKRNIIREQDLSFSPFFFVLSFLFEILRRDINDLHYDNRNDDENNRRAISLQNLKQM